MKLIISEEAADWFMEEMDAKAGDYIQFTVKLYGGIPTMHPGYFLGIQKGKNGDISIKTVVKGIIFYFNQEDAWFLEHYQMEAVVSNGEIEFLFHEEKD